MSTTPFTFNTQELFSDVNSSLLKKTCVSGTNAIYVYSLTNFSVDLILLIGELGEEGSEIIKTHHSTAPLGDTVTLASNMSKDHAKDSNVYIIPYDQLKISHASTIDGTKSVVAMVNIDPERIETIYNDAPYSTGYYFVQYYNSITGVFSSYSDAISVDGYSENTVASAIQQALDETGKELSGKLTTNILIQKLNMMLRLVRGKLKKWNDYQKFDEVIGAISRGENRVSMPLDAYDVNSYRSVLSLRIGSGTSLLYIDKKEYDDIMQSTTRTTVKTEPVVGATSFVLNDTKDLPETGGVSVYVNGEKYSVQYTANDISTGTLSGIPATGDGSITYAFPVNSNVWHGETESEPNYFTIYGGYVYFSTLPNSTQHGNNIFMNYYTDIVTVDSEGDELKMPRYEMAVYYLKSWIRAITENNGKFDFNDPDYAFFQEILRDAIRRENSGQKFKTRPKLNGISYGVRRH